MKVTECTTLKELYENPLLDKGKHYFVGNGEALFREKAESTLKDLSDEQPTWFAGDMTYGMNRLLEIAGQGEEYIYPVYPVHERKGEADKKEVQLFHFPGGIDGSYAIVLAGGGYGCVCSMVEAFPVAAKLNEMGITAFCLNYRTAQPGLLPKPMDDLAAAYRFIEANAYKFHVNPKTYLVAGFSAGGHTAAVWGTRELGYEKYGVPAPEMLLLGYPFITTANMFENMRDMFLAGMLGETYTEEKMHRYNVDQHVHGEYPAVYIVQSQDDDTVPFYHSECFINALKKEGIIYAAEQPETGGHGFGLGSNSPASGWIGRAVAFWKEKVKKPYLFTIF